MSKVYFISEQFKHWRRPLYLLMMLITLIVNVVDIYLLKITPSNPVFYIYLTNIIMVLVLLPGVFLFGMSLDVAKVILIYTIFASIIFSQLLKPQTVQFEALFIRDIVFTVILLLAGGLFLGRKHILLMGGIFVLTFIAKLFILDNQFLWSNSPTMILVVIAFIFIIHSLIHKLEKNHQIQEHYVNELMRANSKLDKHQMELVKINQTKDLFFSILAHDLRNPIQALIGLNEVLHEKIENSEYDEAAFLLAKMETSTQGTFDLLNNLLMWSYAQTGKIHFSPSLINFEEVVNENLEFFETNLHKKQINVQLDLKDAQNVFADKNMLSAVVRNLISNAIKFTPLNGTIKINVHQRSDKLQFKIEDNGQGIPKKHHSQLFDLAYNHTTAGTQNETGTGFGLVICKEFISNHQGEIWLKSKEGIGTSFYFSIPVTNSATTESNPY